MLLLTKGQASQRDAMKGLNSFCDLWAICRDLVSFWFCMHIYHKDEWASLFYCREQTIILFLIYVLNMDVHSIFLVANLSLACINISLSFRGKT